MTNIIALKAANAHRWSLMHMNAGRLGEFTSIAKRLCDPAAKTRYQKISDGTKRSLLGNLTTQVPWFIIGVIHEREADGPPHWDKQLGQGDDLDKRSVNDPVGRGPFFNHTNDPPGEDAFYRGAIDALSDCPPYASKWQDWSIGGSLTLLEEYNGLGYAAMGMPSAYVWSGTNQYVSGKYIADHVYRRNVIDVQEGCAGILFQMMAIDSSIAQQWHP